MFFLANGVKKKAIKGIMLCCTAFRVSKVSKCFWNSKAHSQWTDGCYFTSLFILFSVFVVEISLSYKK